MSESFSFNLLDEPWIPCLNNDGKLRRIGVREALTQAGTIRQIAASNPMDRLAILRFLLALLYWCKGNPPTEAESAPDDSFPTEWFAKLDQNRDCFNLLGEGRRFYQYRGKREMPLTANYLVHEIPTGTNLWHFRHATDGVDGLCPACCALGLLRLPLFATSGGSGKPPGINMKPPLYVIPVGDSLAKTLRLSWCSAPSLGTPAWEKPDISLPKTGEVPLLTGLSWLPRRVWLGNPEESEATCISCGRKNRLITSSVFAGIGSMKTDDETPNRLWRDPHVIYDNSGKSKVTTLHARNALGATDAGAGQWASIVAGMFQQQSAPAATDLPNQDSWAEGGKYSIWVVGFSTVQNDKYLEAIEYTLSLPASAGQSVTAVQLLERWQEENARLARKVWPPDEQWSYRKHPEIASAIAAVRPHVEGKVSAKVGELLTGGDAAWLEAASEYRPMMEAVARSLYPGFTTAAVEWRKHIADTLPDMTTTGPTKKAARKKGGAP